MPDNTLIRKRTNRNEYASLSCSTTRIWECRISTMKRLLSFSQNKAGGAENDRTNTDRNIKRVNADGNRQKTFRNHISNSSRPPTCKRMSRDAILKLNAPRAPRYVLSKCRSVHRRCLNSILFRTYRYISYCFLRVRYIVEYDDRCDYSTMTPDYSTRDLSRVQTCRPISDSPPEYGTFMNRFIA